MYGKWPILGLKVLFLGEFVTKVCARGVLNSVIRDGEKGFKGSGGRGFKGRLGAWPCFLHPWCEATSSEFKVFWTSTFVGVTAFLSFARGSVMNFKLEDTQAYWKDTIHGKNCFYTKLKT